METPKQAVTKEPGAVLTHRFHTIDAGVIFLFPDHLFAMETYLQFLLR